jgi:electron transport complex protein RnfA
LKNAAMMGLAVIFVMTVSSVLTWLVYWLLLLPLGIVYLKVVPFILIIASFVQLVELVVRKYSPALYRAFGIFLPLITTNCAILGIALINIVEGYSLLGATVSGAATGIGFTLALFLMAGIRERLELASPPRAFEGLPLAFVVAALLALAFQGFGRMGV